MPKTRVEFSESEIKEALRDQIRKKYKVTKTTTIKVELFIDRPDGPEGAPVITAGTLFVHED